MSDVLDQAPHGDKSGVKPGTSTELAIEARGLVKRFGDTLAVRGVDITVPRGAIYGILGPNGAGKTTTLRMILGIIDPDEGVRRIFGPCAVGSLDPALGPGAMVVPDQLVDRTSGRSDTYFDSGGIHVGFADPYCPTLRGAVTGLPGVVQEEEGDIRALEGTEAEIENNLNRNPRIGTAENDGERFLAGR